MASNCILSYALLNVAGINAQVTFANNIETQMKRRQFLKSLAKDLMKEHRGERAACSHVSRELRTKLKRRITSPAREPEETRPKFQGCCAICPRSKDRKTKYMCQKCETFLCLQHVIPLCEECVCVCA